MMHSVYKVVTVNQTNEFNWLISYTKVQIVYENLNFCYLFF